jgi:hypothetical protein
MITGEIKTPYAASLYYVADTKTASIDLENRIVTTHNEEQGDRTHTFFKVGKFEMFQILKYVLPLLVILTSDWYSISVKNELSLITLAAALVLWHKYRTAQHKRFFRNVIFFAAIATTIIVPIVGTITWTLSTLFKMYMSAWIAVALYEIALGIASREWERMGKVYMDGLPKFMCYYFTFPESEETAKAKKTAAKKIEKKIFGAAAFIAAIGLIGLTYSSVKIYKSNKLAEARIAEVAAYQDLLQKKEESDRKGKTQIVIKYEKIKLDEKTEKLHKLLDIDPEYKEITTKTYPWEKSYQRGGVFVHKPDGTVQETYTGLTK